MRGWNKAFDDGGPPNDSRVVILATSMDAECVAAQYVSEVNEWFKANTNTPLYNALFWKEFPAHPINNE